MVTSQDRYSDDLEATAWYDENSGGRTHPGGRKAPNAWGLHDMLGNVHEWGQDWKRRLSGGHRDGSPRPCVGYEAGGPGR